MDALPISRLYNIDVGAFVLLSPRVHYISGWLGSTHMRGMESLAVRYDGTVKVRDRDRHRYAPSNTNTMVSLAPYSVKGLISLVLTGPSEWAIY